jgi:hypothetical protein
MADSDDTGARPSPPHGRQRTPLPEGYRQGLITAITVLLGFSLAFFKFWTFEAPGDWTARSVAATSTIALAVGLQIVALFRSLRLEDDSETEYRKTVRWFVASAVVLLLGLLVTVVVFAA